MDEDSSIPTYTIHDEFCMRTGITAKWTGNGGEISIAGFKPYPDKPDYIPPGIVNIHHLKPKFIFDDPILRSLLAEANSIFAAVQDLRRLGSAADYVKLSQTYRSVIRACLEQLQENLSNTSDSLTEDENFNQNYSEYVSIFYSIECIWHLCEILLIDAAPSGVVVPQLLQWTRFHFPSAERMAADLLLDGREASSHEQYWTVVKGLVLQGQIKVVRTLLQMHAMGESNAFRMAEQILRSMPIYDIYGGLSVQKFRAQWQYWLTDTELKLSMLSNVPELEEIIKLVTGHQTTWNEEIKNSSCWYEYLPGYLYYTEPTCKYFELGTQANIWLARWANERNVNNLRHLDRVIHHLMENDMHQVLLAIQNMWDQQWFVTHLTDLLYNCGKLKIMSEAQKNLTSDLREALLFEFGSRLMSRNSFWMIGVDYLEYCSIEGPGAVELLLTKIPIENEKQAVKIVDMAKQKGFDTVERGICRIQATKSISKQRYGNALDWAIRSKDNIFVTSLADFFLKHFAQTGKMLCSDVLSNIGAKMFISPRLVFLVKYFEFLEFYRQKDFAQASELLVSLLDSKITPEYFWPVLLSDTIPLLETKDPKIPSKETLVIMHHLESGLIPLVEKTRKRMADNNSEQPKLLKNFSIEKIEQTLKLLTFSSTRNLSRAIIIENSL